MKKELKILEIMGLSFVVLGIIGMAVIYSFEYEFTLYAGLALLTVAAVLNLANKEK